MAFQFNPLSGQFNIVSSSSGGSGDVSSNTSTSVDSEIALFSGTTGKLIKRATGTGFAKLTSGVLSVGSIAGSDLPNPSASTLGGVQSAAAVSHQWINSISTSGVPALSQPAFTDISGSVAASQLPNPSASTLGGVQSAAAVSNQWINSISTSGVPALSQPAFTNISGTATIAQGGTGQVTASAALTALGGATTALDNIASTQLSADLLFPADVTRSIGQTTKRALKIYSQKFATNDDGTTTAFARLVDDAYNGNPGIQIGTSSTTTTWSRIYSPFAHTLTFNLQNADVLQMSATGFSGNHLGDWGLQGAGYNGMNLYGQFAWNDVYNHANTSNFQISNGVNVAFVTGAGTVGTLTITMPTAGNVMSNSFLTIIFEGAVTTMTWSGTFAITPPATITAGQVCRYIFRGADSKWWPY